MSKEIPKTNGFPFIRALPVLIMILGFYALALAIIAGLALLAWTLITNQQGLSGIKGTSIILGVLAIVLISLWKTLRVPDSTPEGIELTPEKAPQLWKEVERIADAVHTRKPDTILLTTDYNAAVTEKTKYLGLVGGQRFLILGLPLVAALEAGQYRAVLAHEMGHYSANHSSLGQLNYRSAYAVFHLVASLREQKYNPVAWIFRGYAWLFSVVTNAVRRRQELEADRLAAHVAGAETMSAALRELERSAPAWERFVESKLNFVANYDVRPPSLIEGFSQYRASISAELDAAYDESKKNEPTSLHSSHPPTQVRIEALQIIESVSTGSELAPALSLFDNADAMVSSCEKEWLGEPGDITDWDAAMVKTLSNKFDLFCAKGYPAVERALDINNPDFSDLMTALNEAHDQGSNAVKKLWAKLDQQGFYAGWITFLAMQAALQSGALHGTHSWSEGIRWLDKDGNETADDIFGKLLDDDASAVKEAQEQLLSWGVDFSQGRATENAVQAIAADDDRAELMAASYSIHVNEEKKHLLILSDGLLFLPFAGANGWDKGKKLVQIVEEERTISRLCALEDAQWVPFEDIVTARKKFRFNPVAWYITSAGNLSAVYRTKDDRDFHVKFIVADRRHLGRPENILKDLLERLS